MTTEERYVRIIERFREMNPAPETELDYGNAFELLCAVILSAQCTDRRVNMVTPGLFSAYPTPQALAEARVEDVYGLIRSVSYPNNKAKLLTGMARRLVEVYGGEVPGEIDSLLTLPGVGRKTANVMLSVVWGKAAMAVDTHVFRVSERLGLTTGSRTPLETERELVRHIAEGDVAHAHHWLILHGRYVCKARKPDCMNCAVADLCRYHTGG